MRYRLAPLFCRPWTLNGMSPRLIESHYEINYGGALNRLNAITNRPLGGEAVYDGTAASRITRCRRTIARWIARSRQRRALREIAKANDLDHLKDIGVSQEEAFREADKPFWRP
jgi:uncharacterized protein YjiS (DUF1127 family)